MNDDGWMSKAKCQGYNGTTDDEGNVPRKDLFFPISKRKSKMETFDPERNVTDPQEAKRLCRVCPVQNECLDYALSLDPAPDGVWAGMTRRELKRLKQGKR